MKQTRIKNSAKLTWSLDLLPKLDGKTFIITGANSGIGFEATRILANAGARVIMASRSKEKALEAIRSIRNENPKTDIEFMELDLASLASIHTFADKVHRKLSKIDVLCNNAGIMSIPYNNYSTTKDGFELHFGINHFGHFALTGLIFDLLVKTPSSRIVTVSSGGHKIGDTSIRFDDIYGINCYKNGYGRSKLANLLFTYELDRRLKSHGFNMKAVACHPGATKSNLLNAGPDMTKSKPALWLKLVYLGAQSPIMGALPEIYAAVGEDIISGDYIGPSGFQESRGLPTKVQSSDASHDIIVAEKLWKVSEELTGVHFLD